MQSWWRAVGVLWCLLPWLLSGLAETHAAVARSNNQVSMQTISRPTLCEKVSKIGDILSLSYVARLENGTVVDFNDENQGAGRLFEMQLGMNRVIGWDDKLTDMCIDEVRKVTVPPQLERNENVPSHLPTDVPLHYEVTLHGIRRGPPPLNIFKLMDTDQSGTITHVELKHYFDQKIERQRNEIEKYSAHMENLKKQLSKQIKDQHKDMKEVFRKDDINGDDVIDLEEFSGPKHDEF